MKPRNALITCLLAAIASGLTADLAQATPERALAGTVIHRIAATRRAVVATTSGTLVTVAHAGRIGFGQRVDLSGPMAPDGSLSARHITRTGSRRSATASGVVTYSSIRRHLFTLSAPGTSVLVHVPRRLGRRIHLFHPGKALRVAIKIGVRGRLTAVSARATHRKTGPITIQATVLRIRPRLRLLLVSADDNNEAHRRISVLVPSAVALTNYRLNSSTKLRVRRRGARGFTLLTPRTPLVPLGGGPSAQNGGPGAPHDPNGPSDSDGKPGVSPTGPGQPSPAFHAERLTNPDRTVVTDANGAWLATFTDHAYTATVTGPERTFSDIDAANPVVSTTWVRALPTPFDGKVDDAWLARELADGSPDVLDIAAQYLENAPPILTEAKLQVAGDASYGALQADGTRPNGSDFYDYLGSAWVFDGKAHSPDATQLHSLDCSGFMRMVWGYRAGLPLTLVPDGTSIPRSSWQIAESAPGVILGSVTDSVLPKPANLSPGDLVFFSVIDKTHPVDHVGMYLGLDTAGHQRFISSRQKNDGPTLGDTHGTSTLDGNGSYALAFRAVRRL